MLGFDEKNFLWKRVCINTGWRYTVLSYDTCHRTIPPKQEEAGDTSLLSQRHCPWVINGSHLGLRNDSYFLLWPGRTSRARVLEIQAYNTSLSILCRHQTTFHSLLLTCWETRPSVSSDEEARRLGNEVFGFRSNGNVWTNGLTLSKLFDLSELQFSHFLIWKNYSVRIFRLLLKICKAPSTVTIIIGAQKVTYIIITLEAL